MATASPVLGSRGKSGPVTHSKYGSQPGSASQPKAYPLDIKAFTGPAPQKAAEARTAVQDYIDPNILGLKKDTWNKSTYVPLYPKESVSRTLDVGVPLLNSNENMHDLNPRRGNAPPLTRYTLHTEVLAKGGVTGGDEQWDQSTVFNRKAVENDDAQLCKTALESTAKRREAALKGKYVDPVEREAQFVERERARKKRDAEELRLLKEKYGDRWEYFLHETQAWKEKQRPAEATRSPLEEAVEPPRVLSHKVKAWLHTGSYEEDKVDGGMAWSCCKSSAKDARGCSYALQPGPHSWNYASLKC
eukprot:tig00000480_g1304.t1